MTTLYSRSAICSICGCVTQFTAIGSSFLHGTRDLDLRPPALMRNTMRYWVQECPNCGYVARSIDKPARFRREFLSSPKYMETDGLAIDNDQARRFFRQHLCAMEENDIHLAIDALIRAAWCCDDNKDETMASLFRKRAIELIDREKARNNDIDEQRIVQRADLLRRSGQFTQLINEYSDFSASKEIHQQIIAFQLDRAENNDAGCYTIDDALAFIRDER